VTVPRDWCAQFPRRHPLDPRSCLNQLSSRITSPTHCETSLPFQNSTTSRTPFPAPSPSHAPPPPHPSLLKYSSLVSRPHPPISSAAPAYLGNISSITPSLDSSARRCPPRRPIVGSSVFPTEPSPSFYLLRPLDLPQIRHYLWSRFPPIPIPNRNDVRCSIFLIHTLFQPISKSIIVIFRPHILLTIIIL